MLFQVANSAASHSHPVSTPYSRAAVQHWSGQRSDSCEQQQRCSIATSLVKQLTSSPAERLLLRVPVGRVPSCPRLSTVCPLSSVLCPPPPLSCRLSCRICFPHPPPFAVSLRTVLCWWQPSVLVVVAVAVWIDLSVLCVMSRVSSFFRLVFLPPPLCGWSAVVVFAISCAIGHGCSECGSGFLTRDWLGHEV